MTTRIYGRSTIEQAIDLEPCATLMRKALLGRARGGSRAGEKHSAHLHPRGSVHLLFPGVAEGVPAFTVKVNAKFPHESPPIRGVVMLHDLATGHPLAILDSGAITAWRTAVMGAISADAHAPDRPIDVAILGAGTQGATQLRLLSRVRPLRSVRVHDSRAERAHALVARCAPDIPHAAVSASPEDAISEADVVVTATWSRVPLFAPEALKPGAHVLAIGCDEAGKHEVSPRLARSAFFTTDDRDLAVTRGILAGQGIDAGAVHELADVLAGIARPPRAGTSLFAPVGHPFEDLVAAWTLHIHAKDETWGRADLDA